MTPEQTLNLTMLILLAAFAWWYPREKTEKDMTKTFLQN